jgi:hypothetical protein
MMGISAGALSDSFGRGEESQPSTASSLDPSPTPTFPPTSPQPTSSSPPTPSPTVSPSSLVYDVDSNNDGLYTLHIDTREEVEFIGTFGQQDRYTTPVALAKDDDTGRIVTWNNSPDQDHGLSVVNPNNATATLVGPTSEIILQSLAYRNGQLYGADNVLYAIDDLTGSVTKLCDLEFRIGGMGTAKNKVMYGVELSLMTERLVTIEPTSCSINTVGVLSENIGTIGSVAWNERTQRLLGSAFGNNPFGGRILFDIDPRDATVTNIRSADRAPQGMVFVS